jgi:hypothetical protein
MDFDWSQLVNYGALGICLAYFIYKDMRTNKENRESQEQSNKETRATLEGVKDALNGLKEVVSVLKEVVDRK